MLSIVKACGDLALLRHLRARLVVIITYYGHACRCFRWNSHWLIKYTVPCRLRGLQAALQGEAQAARYLSSHTATARGLQTVIAGRGSARNETETT
jgi:hypothetical protein